MAVAWLLLLTAAARPLWLEHSTDFQATGRDLLVAVDISGSMKEKDMTASGQSRFEVVQNIAGEFVKRRHGDRVGLILFGTTPYLHAPLTFDVDTVALFLDESRVGFAGSRTSIGDTIAMAVKVLRDRPATNRILVLLTDGDNTSGHLNLGQAKTLAVEFGVRVYAITIGPQQLLQGSRIDLARGVGTKPVLQEIAEATGGVYYHADDAVKLEEIYQSIDKFEPVEIDDSSLLTATELYPWPLALTALLIALTLFIRSVPLAELFVGNRQSQ